MPPPLPDNLTSQFWANCYVNPFDHFVKRELRCQGYVRYVDDFLLFGPDKPTLWAWHRAIVARLAGLRLTLHPGARPGRSQRVFPFWGLSFFPSLAA